MEENQIGLNVKFNDIGYVDLRHAVDLHSVKSVAGTLFHSPRVKSVCVYDPRGVVHLYLKKTSDGIIREER
jgi:hypothetical protein